MLTMWLNDYWLIVTIADLFQWMAYCCLSAEVWGLAPLSGKSEDQTTGNGSAWAAFLMDDPTKLPPVVAFDMKG